MSQPGEALLLGAFVDAVRTALAKHGAAGDADIADELPAAFERAGLSIVLVGEPCSSCGHLMTGHPLCCPDDMHLTPDGRRLLWCAAPESAVSGSPHGAHAYNVEPLEEEAP